MRKGPKFSNKSCFDSDNFSLFFASEIDFFNSNLYGEDKGIFFFFFFFFFFSGALIRQRTIPTERPPLVGEVSANLADRGCRVVSATNPHGR
jgi:hypothetical protein